MNELTQKKIQTEFISWRKNCMDIFWGVFEKRAKQPTVLSNVQNDYGHRITKQLQPNNIHYQNCRAHYTHIIYFYSQNHLVYAILVSIIMCLGYFYVYMVSSTEIQMLIEVYCRHTKNRPGESKK